MSSTITSVMASVMDGSMMSAMESVVREGFWAVKPVQLPNPAAIDPTGGAKGVSLLFSYVKWAVFVICGLVALGSMGAMAGGSMSNRPEYADRGKRAFLWSLVAAIGASIAIPTVNAVISASS